MAGEGASHGANPAQEPASPDRIQSLRLAGALRTLLRYHQQMGIEQYPFSPGLQQFLCPGCRQARPNGNERQAVETVSAEGGEVPHPERSGSMAATLRALDREIEDCRQCSLASARQGVVHGSGTADALLLVVGDYSAQNAEFSAAALFGEAEDAMLWNMMRAIGLTPEQVYVTNAVKCCPPPAEAPQDDSMRCCYGYLMREIELVRPRLVCAMGEIAVRSLVGAQETLVRMRGRFHPCGQRNPGGEPLQVMATFHPRFLLQNVELKKAAWQDLQMVQRQLQAR
ncbi:MAG: uracil-DNA glycosylase [Desulfobulbus sp.]|nr:uracil-DNA glycosylase [Desulfobulbus sp.]